MNSQPLDKRQAFCPKHDTPMVEHIFEPDAKIPKGVQVLRCPNLSCSMFYATGAMQGFYIRTPSGELTPYEIRIRNGER
jgi:hypothetical protein